MMPDILSRSLMSMTIMSKLNIQEFAKDKEKDIELKHLREKFPEKYQQVEQNNEQVWCKTTKSGQKIHVPNLWQKQILELIHGQGVKNPVNVVHLGCYTRL